MHNLLLISVLSTMISFLSWVILLHFPLGILTDPFAAPRASLWALPHHLGQPAPPRQVHFWLPRARPRSIHSNYINYWGKELSWSGTCISPRLALEPQRPTPAKPALHLPWLETARFKGWAGHSSPMLHWDSGVLPLRCTATTPGPQAWHSLHDQPVGQKAHLSTEFRAGS